ncbi:hypothetical protein WN51_08592 [Melipona quadrifasciata]|uniref:Uncharacterized protein n=1 Tax=Melipona quadrifasciata TaxID=166423 RepID=A0A0M9A9R1_9HYME|nr:hypothetical protein WN51_08592 [Melipona quadrifasciata]
MHEFYFRWNASMELAKESRNDAVAPGHLGIIVLTFSRFVESGPNPLNHKDYNTALTIFRTTFLLFYDKFLQYVTKFATMTSGQRNKSVVHPEQRYAYMPCPLYDTDVKKDFRPLSGYRFRRLLMIAVPLVICHWNANRAGDRVFYEIRESCRPGVGNKGNWIPIAGK